MISIILIISYACICLLVTVLIFLSNSCTFRTKKQRELWRKLPVLKKKCNPIFGHALIAYRLKPTGESLIILRKSGGKKTVSTKYTDCCATTFKLCRYCGIYNELYNNYP